LVGKEDYDYYAQEAIEAERAMVVSPSASAALSRKAMELAIKYVYEHDADVVMPYESTLSALMYEPSFKNILSPGLLDLLTYIRKLGNLVLHENKRRS
jgi:type I restriction enzyme R subunit